MTRAQLIAELRVAYARGGRYRTAAIALARRLNAAPAAHQVVQAAPPPRRPAPVVFIGPAFSPPAPRPRAAPPPPIPPVGDKVADAVISTGIAAVLTPELGPLAAPLVGIAQPVIAPIASAVASVVGDVGSAVGAVGSAIGSFFGGLFGGGDSEPANPGVAARPVGVTTGARVLME